MNKTFYFIMNDMRWSVEKKSQEDIKRLADDDSDKGVYYGLTEYSTHSVYLWDELCDEQAERTLMHELMHVYIWSYVTHQTSENYTEEALCDISANSHDIIEDIVKRYAEEN